MNVEVYIYKRNKKFGFYQNDTQNERIATFEGLAADDYIMNETYLTYQIDGSAVLGEDIPKGKVLYTRKDLLFYADVNHKAFMKYGSVRYEKYRFIYRVEEKFFERLKDDESYAQWSEYADIIVEDEKGWLKEQLDKFNGNDNSFDFEQNYYYVIASV